MTISQEEIDSMIEKLEAKRRNLLAENKKRDYKIRELEIELSVYRRLNQKESQNGH